MPYQITFDKFPIGYCAKSAKVGDTKALVITSEFSSSEDGDSFIQRLEGFPAEVISALPILIKPSMVDHLVVVLNLDKTATVYVNELKFIGNIRSKRNVKKGEFVYTDDIAEIKNIKFNGIEDIPKN